VRSRPIIEDSSALRFAPYAFSFAGRGGACAAALTAAGLTEECAADVAAWRDAWRRVDDFAWLRTTPSPHWAEMPQQERAAPPPPPPASDEEEEQSAGAVVAAVAEADADEL
jgi:hypothetical protein